DSAPRHCRRGEAERCNHLVVKQCGNGPAELALKHQLQQHITGMRVDPLLPGLLVFARLPRVECAEELSQGVRLRDPRRVVRWQKKPGRMRCKLANGYAPDVTALPQLGYVFADWIVEGEVPSRKGLGHDRCFENLADRSKIEQRVRRDQLLLRGIG